MAGDSPIMLYSLLQFNQQNGHVHAGCSIRVSWERFQVLALVMCHGSVQPVAMQKVCSS